MRDPGPDIEPEFYHSLSSCWPLGQCAACTASYVPRDMSRNAVTSERKRALVLAAAASNPSLRGITHFSDAALRLLAGRGRVPSSGGGVGLVVAADGPVTPPTEASQGTLTDLEARLKELDVHAVDALRLVVGRRIINVYEAVAAALVS